MIVGSWVSILEGVRQLAAFMHKYDGDPSATEKIMAYLDKFGPDTLWGNSWRVVKAIAGIQEFDAIRPAPGQGLTAIETVKPLAGRGSLRPPVWG